MSILELKNKNTFDNQLKKIIYIFKFDKILPSIVGSASLKSQRFYSDYDLLTVLNKKYDDRFIYDRITDIISELLKDDDVYLMELKIQSKNGDKHRWYFKDKFEYNDFKMKIKDVDFIKIDIIARINNRFVEVSSIFDFSLTKENKNDIKKRLFQDITELKKEKKYYKILKRLFSIYKINKNHRLLKLLSDYFNSDIGKLYQLNSNIDAINNLLKLYNDKVTKDKAIINLKDIGSGDTSLTQLAEIYDNNFKEINNDAKKFITTHSLLWGAHTPGRGPAIV